MTRLAVTVATFASLTSFFVTRSAPAQAQEPTVPSGFVFLSGTDTLSIDRYTRTRDSVTGSVTIRAQDLREAFVFPVAADGTVPRIDLMVTKASDATGAVLQRASAVFAGDSVSITAGGQSTRLAAPHGAIPFINLSGVFIEQMLMRAKRLGGTTASVQMFLMAGGTTPVATVQWIGADSATLTIGGAQVRAHVSPAGALLGGSIPAQGLRIVRAVIPIAPGGAPTAPPLPPGVSSDPMNLVTPTGTIVGTLDVPAGPRTGPVPVAVIIAGSGPTDRDGNSPLVPGANNSLRLLAEGLATRGIASVRYDKRGIGASLAAGTKEADLRFDMYADDAAAWVRQLRADSRFSTVTIVGHSEGSLLGMLAVQRSGADGYVSIAGIGRRADVVLHEQVSTQLPPDLLAASDHIAAELTAGRTVDSVPDVLKALYRPSVQPYIMSWFRYDPIAELQRVTVPVLIAQGTTDIQVPPSEAQVLARAHPGATVLMVDGMNHVLKVVRADQTAQVESYSDPSLPVASALLDGVATFVQGVKRR